MKNIFCLFPDNAMHRKIKDIFLIKIKIIKRPVFQNVQSRFNMGIIVTREEGKRLSQLAVFIVMMSISGKSSHFISWLETDAFSIRKILNIFRHPEILLKEKRNIKPFFTNAFFFEMIFLCL
ncbi:MAG: hypothetical protein QXO70_02265 [Candidatus Pacearchaeota archaeon]